MIEHVEEIKKLIQDGFDIELISFELDIPIKELRQLKKEIESSQKPNARKYSAQEIIDKENKNAHLKMEQMREKYNKIFFENNRDDDKKTEELSQEEIDIINSKLAEIEEKIGEMKELSKQERRKETRDILSKAKKTANYQMTVEQAEKLLFLMQSEELKNLSLSSTDKIDAYINQYKKLAIKKLAEAIDTAQSQTEEIEELRDLEKKLTIKMAQNNPIVVGTVKSKLGNKITKINQKNASERIRNNIPISIENIIRDIASGTLDIQVANEAIDEETRKILESRPKNRFAFKEEQAKNQVLIQIRTVLMEKSEQYHIENPDIAIMQIQKLCGGELEQAIRTVVKNLIGAKDFEGAKGVCTNFASKYNGSLSLIGLRKEIRNAEIADIVLKGININGTMEEEKAYFKLIEKGLERGNVKLSAISLGKSQDGLRNITLADIWPEETQKVRV